MKIRCVDKYQWQPIIKITASNKNNLDLISRDQVHSKTTIEPKNKQNKESREKITTPRNVYPVRSNHDLLWEEIDLSNSLSMSSLQRDTKWVTRN